LNDILHLCYAQASLPNLHSPDRVMQEAVRILQERLGEPFAMQEVSASLGLSPVQFTRQFRAAFGKNPSEYLASLRLHKARDLLLETDWTIQSVAESCGYTSGFYLSRVFQRAMKMSPGRFRETHRL